MDLELDLPLRITQSFDNKNSQAQLTFKFLKTMRF